MFLPSSFEISLNNLSTNISAKALFLSLSFLTSVKSLPTKAFSALIKAFSFKSCAFVLNSSDKFSKSTIDSPTGPACSEATSKASAISVAIPPPPFSIVDCIPKFLAVRLDLWKALMVTYLSKFCSPGL